jgi:hypothetical protein
VHREVDLASARWLLDADVAGAADSAAVLRLLASSEKSYTQMTGHVLTTVLQPLRTDDSVRAWLSSDDAAGLVGAYEADCALHRDLLLHLAREASKPDPVDATNALMRWVPALAASCTGVAAAQARCGRLLARRNVGAEAQAYVLKRNKGPGTLCDGLGLPVRRLDEYVAVAKRADELSPRATRPNTSLVDMLSTVLSACDQIASNAAVGDAANDVDLVGDDEEGGSDDTLLLRCSSEHVATPGAAAGAPADLLLHEGVLLVVRPCYPASGRVVVARCPLPRATIHVDSAEPCQVIVSNEVRACVCVCVCV